MISIELTLAQKIQIGFVVVVLGIAGLLVYRYTRSVPDMTIEAWGPEKHEVGLDPRKPVSAKNLADTSKTFYTTRFACQDGQLWIYEYPEETGTKATFKFIPDLTVPIRGMKYTFYVDPLARVKALTDPYKLAISMTAYNGAMSGRSMAILNGIGMSPEEANSEKSLRDRMMTQVDLMQNGAQTGTYEPEMYETVMRALATYRAREGDAGKDAAKAALAWKVVQRAMEYLEKLHKEEAVAIDKYIAGVTSLLNEDEKAKLVEAFKPPPGPGARAARPKAATTPAKTRPANAPKAKPAAATAPKAGG